MLRAIEEYWVKIETESIYQASMASLNVTDFLLSESHPLLKHEFFFWNLPSMPLYSVKSDPPDPSNPFVHHVPDPGTKILPERVKLSSLHNIFTARSTPPPLRVEMSN